MKATRKTVDDAIECLLTCAADRQRGDFDAYLWRVVTPGSDVWLLAVATLSGAPTLDRSAAHRYGAAASLLHEGWLPEGWTS